MPVQSRTIHSSLDKNETACKSPHCMHAPPKMALYDAAFPKLSLASPEHATHVHNPGLLMRASPHSVMRRSCASNCQGRHQSQWKYSVSQVLLQHWVFP